VGHQPVQRLQQRRHGAAGRVDADRAAQRDDVAHALGGLVRAVQREDTAQAPAHQADLAAALVVHVADLLLDRRGVPGPEADVAPEAPGLHRIAAAAQEDLQRHQRALGTHEAGQQQHRVAITARRVHQQRQGIGQRRDLQERPGFEHRAEQAGFAFMGNSRGHRVGSPVF